MSSRKAFGHIGAALLLALVMAASALAATRSANSSAAEPQVLNVWDYGASPKVSKAFNSIWRAFEKTHPGVTIKRRSFGGGNDFDTVFTTAMAAGKGPDIWTGTVSSPNTRVSIKRGLVLDMTSYYCKYHWDDKLARNQIGLSTVKSKFYGVPDGIESLVVFYNKDVFRQLGVRVPTTWAQLQQIVVKAKAKGLTPISWATSRNGLVRSGSRRWSPTVSARRVRRHSSSATAAGRNRVSWARSSVGST